MASIRKREIQYKVGRDGNVRKGFAYDVYYSYKNPATGKLKRTSKKGFKTQSEAKAFLIEFESNKIRGTFKANSKLILKDFLGSWLEEKKQSKATGTFVNYNNYVKKHISPYIGGMYISDLLSEDIIKLRAELLKPKHGLKKITINRAIKVLSMALGDAVKQKIISYNVQVNLLKEYMSFHVEILIVHTNKLIFCANLSYLFSNHFLEIPDG